MIKTNIRLIALILAVAGVVILLSSTAWGIRSFHLVVRSFANGLSGEEVRLAYEGLVASLRLLGGILLFTGLWKLLEQPRGSY